MNQKPPKYSSLRAAIVGAVFMFCLVVIGARAGYLQLYKGSWLSSKAAGQYEKELTIPGKRGTIYDTRHQAMAISIETTSIAAYPGAIEDKKTAAAQLAKALHLKRSRVQRKLSSPRPFVWIKRQAAPKETEAVKGLNLKGIDYLPEYSRFYPNTSLAAQVLGFTGIDGQGLEGLEFYYNRLLKGAPRTVTIIKDALGRGFETDQLTGLHQAGNNLVLTIDRHVQYICEQALADAVSEHKARSGMAIVMVPNTGAILAMAHYPLFNPNTYRKYNRETWRNRAITDAFEPGSTLKIFSAAAALNSGASTARTIYYCEDGTYAIGPHTVHDTKPHGWLSLQQIIKYSSNIGAVKVVEQIGSQVLYENLVQFGFGRRTQIDSPGEAHGSLSHYKRWTVVDTGAIAFGQGVAVTGLQLITAVAALANDGMMMRPYLVQAITDPNGRPLRTVEPVAVHRAVSADTAHTVRRILRTVITHGGTGVEADLEGYYVSGKTGTAQKINGGKYDNKRYLSSFVGFAPTERPVLTVLVVVDEPRDTIYGGLVAAPAFKKIIKETLAYMNIAPAGDLKKLRVSRDVKVNG